MLISPRMVFIASRMASKSSAARMVIEPGSRNLLRPHSSKFAAPLAMHFKSIQLEPIRAALGGLGLTRMPRHPTDDPVIVESWL